jgi:hypothetical protein
MYVLETGEGVARMQFLPDGRRLLALTETAEKAVSLAVWPLSGGEPVRLPLPRLRAQDWWTWHRGHVAAVHPSGDRCYVAWEGGLFAFRTGDGAPLPAPAGVRAREAVLAPGGGRLLAADRVPGGEGRLSALAVDAAGGTLLWRRAIPRQFHHLAGFLPDGERFVTVEDAVCIRTFAAGEEEAAVRYPGHHASTPQLSPDGRHLAVIGYGSMYLFETAPLGKPRRITSSRTFGNFVSFAFHPGGRTLAVIHGGPTLVKLYDLATLRLARTLRWKVGPLAAVAFSPDGMLGAAGSRDGRIVVWDVDE